jgi:hypothetical protein
MTNFNPYRRDLPNQNGKNMPSAASGTNFNQETYSTINNMGCQSQRRNGAIKACKKRSTRIKSFRTMVQRSFKGGVAFVPSLHCEICVANRLIATGHQGVRVPHRFHDVRCPKNRKTKGMSQQQVLINRSAEQNLYINNIAPASN